MAQLTGRFIVNNNHASDFEVTFQLTNNTDKTVHACTFGTPLEIISNSHHIKIVDDETNQPIEYRGVLAKRSPPTVSGGDYVTIQPGGLVQYKQAVCSFPFKAGNRYRISVGEKWECLTEYSDDADEITLIADVEPCVVTLA